MSTYRSYSTKRRRESALESWCRSWVRVRGIVVSKLTDPTGIQDSVFWIPGGRPVIVEFKDPLGKTAKGREELQTEYQKIFKKHGYVTAKITTRKDFVEFMNENGVR